MRANGTVSERSESRERGVEQLVGRIVKTESERGGPVAFVRRCDKNNRPAG